VESAAVVSRRPRSRRWGIAATLATSVALVGVAPVGAQEVPPAVSSVVPRLVTPIFSARRVPDLLIADRADAAVAVVADDLMDRAPTSSCLVVRDGDRVVYERNPDLPLAPASTHKLGTSLAALERLGPDHRAVTEVRTGSEPVVGVVDGDLFLVGGGDPLLVTPGYLVTLQDRDNRLTSSFDDLADAVVASGVREVRGRVVGDDGRYDDVRYVDSWPDRYQRQDTVGPLSALTVNDGVTGLSVDPDEPADVRRPGEPTLLAAQTMQTLLEDRGVTFSGEPTTGRAPTVTTEVARHESPPLRDVLSEVLGWSDNYAAELLLKELGRSPERPGTTADGLAAVRDVLAARGLPIDGLVLNDGSGLDEGNRTTCRFLAALLAVEPQDSPIVDNLSVASESGTLFQRMGGTPAEGRIRAKTGTLNSVLGLAGYADTVPGSQLTFAFVVNIPPTGDPDATTALQDELANVLVAYPDAPPVSSLEPLPVTSG